VGEAPAYPIIALSDDPLLLEAVTGAVLAGSFITTSPSPDRFVDQLVAHGAGIALIDATSVSTPLKPFLVTLREQFPQLLVLLAGSAQLQAQFGPQIADGTVFRFVHKPASSQRLKLFLDAAARELATDSPPPVAPAPPRAARSKAPGGRRGVMLAVLAGVVLAVAVIGWLLWQRSAAPDVSTASPAESSAPAPISPAAPSEPPAGTISSEQAAELAAREAAAREQAARQATALEQAQRTAQGARADQVNVYVQLARKRLISGALIEPADDSARSYLASAQALASEDAEVRALSIALGEALIARFRHAVAVGDAAEAQRWLQACSDDRISTATLNELSAQLQQLQATARAAATAAASPAPAAPSLAPVAPSLGPTAPAIVATMPANAGAAVPTAPAPGAAASAPTPSTAPQPAADNTPAPAADAIIPEGSLTRVQFERPVYPEDALSRGINGWVDLEFTVTAEGKVTNIVTLTSEPRGVFDHAARSALAGSRYRPMVRDGVPTAVRTRIRVRFQQ
jgi:periplasmic protein TonB